MRNWGPKADLFPTIYEALMANWGEHPEQIDEDQDYEDRPLYESMDVDHRTGWYDLTPSQRAYVEKCFNGQTLPQVLELIKFMFVIDGCCRPATHQIVRTRQAGFMQHGGRDNDWRHRRFTMPETMARACAVNEQYANAVESGEVGKRGGITPEGRKAAKQQILEAIERTNYKHCIVDWKVFDILDDAFDLGDESRTPYLRDHIEHVIGQCKTLYAALVDAGIPWEDARRILPMGLQTYIHGVYDWPTFSGTMKNRLEHVMDWEYNCIAQLMMREIYLKCPTIFRRHIGSHSDFQGAAAYGAMTSWPPDGKHPSKYDICGVCGGYDPDGHMGPSHQYVPKDGKERAHRPEQNPYWILDPDCFFDASIPINWIPTNGTWPKGVDRLVRGKRIKEAA